VNKEFRRGPAEYEKERAPEGKVELEPRKKIYVGVMGYSSQKFDTDNAWNLLGQAFDDIQKNYRGFEIWIVSEYTWMGIPALAYHQAKDRGWMTMGIACKKANEYKVFPCDDVVIVGENWGDESPTFLAQCEIFVRVGGGKQSLHEIEQAKAEGKKVYEYELEAQ